MALAGISISPLHALVSSIFSQWHIICHKTGRPERTERKEAYISQRQEAAGYDDNSSEGCKPLCWGHVVKVGAASQSAGMQVHCHP